MPPNKLANGVPSLKTGQTVLVHMLSVNSALITCSTALSFRQRAKSKRNKNEFFTDIHSTSKRNIYDLRRVFPESSSQFQLTIYPLYVNSDRCCVERACV